MKLKDDFFKVESFDEQDDNLNYVISFEPQHFIYEAHFPGNPVTPGVCIIQMIQELAMDYLQANLFLQRVVKAKFSNVINPLEHKEVKVSVAITKEDAGVYKLTAMVYKDDLTFAQLNLELN